MLLTYFKLLMHLHVCVCVHAAVSSRFHVSTVGEDVAVDGGAQSNISDITNMLLRS